MLPINHLKRTLDQRFCNGWEFSSDPENGRVFFVTLLQSGSLYRCLLLNGVWFSDIHQDNAWHEDSFLANRLNGQLRDDDGKPTPLVSTNLLAGEKGLLSFATQELKDDFLSHAPLMESNDKEAAQ